jgi:hypothetical protein
MQTMRNWQRKFKDLATACNEQLALSAPCESDG